GGGFLVVEGTAGGVVLAALPELYPGIHHFHNVDAIEQIVDEGLGDKGAHRQTSGMLTGSPAGHQSTEPGFSRQRPEISDSRLRFQPLSFCLTCWLTAPTSARPCTWGLRMAMTLPMSRGP